MMLSLLQLILVLSTVIHFNLTATCPNLCRCAQRRRSLFISCNTANSSQLRDLDVRGSFSVNIVLNEVESIEKPLFLSTKKLRKLIIVARKLSAIHSSAFDNLNNLKELSFERTQLLGIEADLFELRNLTSLSFKYNLKLESIANITNLQHLTSLTLLKNPSLQIDIYYVNRLINLHSLKVDTVKSFNLQNKSV